MEPETPFKIMVIIFGALVGFSFFDYLTNYRK